MIQIQFKFCIGLGPLRKLTGGIKMQIKELYVSQRKLRNVDQLQQMIETIETEDCLPRIDIWVDEFGRFQVNDGHHRLVAY